MMNSLDWEDGLNRTQMGSCDSNTKKIFQVLGLSAKMARLNVISERSDHWMDDPIRSPCRHHGQHPNNGAN